MSLKRRLDTLRRQGGARPGAPESSHGGDASLRERLERVGGPGRLGRGRKRQTVDAGTLASVLGGEAIGERVVCVETHVPASGIAGECLNSASLLPGVGPLPGERAVFVDTETSGLAGGTGTVAYLVGLARFAGGSLHVRQFLMTGFGGETGMLAAVRTALGDDAQLVSYNGKSFDAPLLKDRFRLTRQDHPLEGAEHVDLLHPARRLFRHAWPDCRLATAEQHLLGLQREDDLPGSQAPLVWFDLVQHGETARLPAVLRHNLQDLTSLAALWPALAAAHAEPQAWGACPLAAARAWCRAGREGDARRVLEAAPALTPAGWHELARLRRRAGDWEGALALWQTLAEAGDERAAEALAKYHEHVRRDWHTALAWTDRLRPTLETTRRRRLRLERKSGKAKAGQGDLFSY